MNIGGQSQAGSLLPENISEYFNSDDIKHSTFLSALSQHNYICQTEAEGTYNISDAIKMFKNFEQPLTFIENINDINTLRSLTAYFIYNTGLARENNCKWTDYFQKFNNNLYRIIDNPNDTNTIQSNNPILKSDNTELKLESNKGYLVGTDKDCDFIITGNRLLGRIHFIIVYSAKSNKILIIDYVTIFGTKVDFKNKTYFSDINEPQLIILNINSDCKSAKISLGKNNLQLIF